MTDLALDSLGFRINDVSDIVGMNVNTVRSYITRHGLFPEFRDRGKGNYLHFEARHLLMLEAARTLHESSLSTAAACDVVAQSGAWPFRLGSQWLRAQPNHEGRWQQVVYNPAGELTITVNLAATWDRLVPGIRQSVEASRAAGALTDKQARRIEAELTLASALAWDNVDDLRQIAADELTHVDLRQLAVDRVGDIEHDRTQRAREHISAEIAKLREQHGYADGLRETVLDYHRLYLVANMAPGTSVPASVRDEVAAQPFGDEALTWLDDMNQAARDAGHDV